MQNQSASVPELQTHVYKCTGKYKVRLSAMFMNISYCVTVA